MSTSGLSDQNALSIHGQQESCISSVHTSRSFLECVYSVHHFHGTRGNALSRECGGQSAV
jgi:hypothetical protein